MTDAQGQTAVTTSALICSGLYIYRKGTETFKREPKVQTGPFKASLGSYAEGVVGYGELLPTGAWLTGMGLTFIGLSIAASVNPTFGGSFAILVAVGSILGNGQAAIGDLKGGLKGPSGKPVAEGRAPSLQPLQPLEGKALQPLEGKALNQPPLKG